MAGAAQGLSSGPSKAPVRVELEVRSKPLLPVPEAVRLLLWDGKDPIGHDGSGHTPFLRAVRAGNQAAAHRLLREAPGQVWDLSAITKSSALHLAASAGAWALVLRIHHQAPSLLHSPNVYGLLPVSQAARRGCLQALQALLALAPDTAGAVSQADGNTLLHFAAASGSVDAVAWLLQRLPPHLRAATNRHGSNALSAAIACNQVAAAEALLRTSPDMATAASSQGTALHLAVMRGRPVALASAVLRHVPHITAIPSAHGRLPIHEAAMHHPAALRLLIQAAPESAAAATAGGMRPLHYAAALGDPESVEALLLAAPNSLYAEDGAGNLPVHDAAYAGNTAALRALLQAGPGLACRANQRGWQPLDMALDAAGRLPPGSAGRRQRLEAARALLQFGEPPALLRALRRHRPVADPLFASLASSRHISKRSWKRMPPLAGLAAALPAVLGRSEREARWLVRRLPQESRRRLRAFALALARLQCCGRIPALPRDVVACLLTMFDAQLVM